MNASQALAESTEALTATEASHEAVERELRAALAECEQAVQRLLRTRFKLFDALESATIERGRREAP